MAAIGKKERFVKKKCEANLRRALKWTRFRNHYLREFGTRTHPKCNKHRSWKIWKELLESGEYPEAKYDRVCKQWEQMRKNLKKGTESKKRIAITRRLPQSKLEHIKAIAEQRIKLSRETRIHEAETRAARAAERAALKRLEHQERIIKERAEKMEEMERKKEQVRQEVREALTEPNEVRVKDEGETNVLRDIRWVYENFVDLIETDSNGVERLNPKVLKKAPSNGAIAIARYALADMKSFFDKYCVKLLPKDGPQKSQGGKEEDDQAELDPDFGALDRYIKGDGS